MAVLEPPDDHRDRRIFLIPVDLSGLPPEKQFTQAMFNQRIADLGKRDAISVAKDTLDLWIKQRQEIHAIGWKATVDAMAKEVLRAIADSDLERMTLEDIKSFASNLNAQILLAGSILGVKGEFEN